MKARLDADPERDVDATQDDDALMTRVARGEEAAFRLLVLRWESQVLAFGIHMLGSREEAEDLVQDAFIQVFRKAGSYKPAGTFRAWLFKVAGNLARSRLRRRRIVRWISFDPALHERAGSGPSPMEVLEEGQNARRVRTALAHLPERQRQALVLHRFQDMRYKEVAAAMDTTLAGVESLIQRGLMALRADLKAEEASDESRHR